LTNTRKPTTFVILKKKIHIIGGGAASLSFACHIDTHKYDVFLHEKNKTLGRKFLVAGEGGLNITHSEPIQTMIKRYHPSNFIEPFLKHFSNQDLIQWLNQLGIQTYVGSSGRVFPNKNIKPIQVLNILINKMKVNGVNVFTEHQLMDWNNDELIFDNKGLTIYKPYDIAVFSLGGSSWKITGSDGAWLEQFMNKGIKTVQFKSSNSSCYTYWDKNFIGKNQGKYIKNIEVKCKENSIKGEIVLTKNGIEGACIYALNRQIREELELNNFATILIDLKPNWDIQKMEELMVKNQNLNITEFLKTKLNLNKTAIELLKIHLNKEEFIHHHSLFKAVKNLKIKIQSLAPIDEAISTVGGIELSELNSDLELKKHPTIHCIGEMLNWDAPTGGYLLQACFSMGKFLADKINQQ
jgi:uncharacterized flavoprotein (TIGR03862 family)